MDEYLPSFCDEIIKIAEQTTDPNAASQMLAQTQKTPNRGPHPALNLEALKVAGIVELWRRESRQR